MNLNQRLLIYWSKRLIFNILKFVILRPGAEQLHLMNIWRRKGVKKLPKVISKHIKCCPYCCSEEYYIKQSFKGTCDYHMRFDGEETENGEMHANATYKNISKYAWCSECNKRLFKIEE